MINYIPYRFMFAAFLLWIIQILTSLWDRQVHSGTDLKLTNVVLFPEDHDQPILHKYMTSSQENILAVKTIQRKLQLLPDITDRGTILTLANMSAIAYASSDDEIFPIPEFDPVGSMRNSSVYAFVFATTDRSLIVIALKGTSFGFLGGGGPTRPIDKMMDNLMFSCCCAAVSYSWDVVCPCCHSPNKCNTECVQDYSRQKYLYYFTAKRIFDFVTQMFPNSHIWFTGHSLGGALASLLAATSPHTSSAVTFAAPGEKLYAKRLGLDVTSDLPIWQFGIDKDPIFTGTCTGSFSSCSRFGYAMESKCHLGKECVYNVPGYNFIGKHKLIYLMNNILSIYEPPVCVENENCTDCESWVFE